MKYLIIALTLFTSCTVSNIPVTHCDRTDRRVVGITEKHLIVVDGCGDKAPNMRYDPELDSVYVNMCFELRFNY
jgi:hypothetical protein